jgi:Na+-translocating ferredoxin:NAD+ oxidoreductase RnfC subunit
MKAGDGSSLQLPPAFVLINPRQHRRYKKGNQDQVDGRTSGAKELMSRINKRKMKEQVEEKQISEAAPSNTERAQKQIAQKKKLRAQKQLQSKKDTAKKAMQSKSDEMNILMKARLADFKKKAGTQTKKLTKQQTSDSIQLDGDKMISEGQDAIQVALDVATQELNPSGETTFAKINFADGSSQNLDNFSAKRIAATYAQLEGEHQKQFQFMLNKDASTFQTALDFAIRNV